MPSSMRPSELDLGASGLAEGNKATSTPPSDLMAAFLNHDKGPVPTGTPWFGGEGEVIGHTTDVNGSTGLEPVTPFTNPDPADALRRSELPKPNNPPVTAAMAKRLVELKKMMGGRQ
jgi:hypothetical protein